MSLRDAGTDVAAAPAPGPGPVPARRERRTCRICGSDAPAALYIAREMMFGTREPFAYFQCAACGCLQIDSVPADLARHYGPGYYSYAQHAPRTGVQAMLVRARNRHLVGDFDPLGALVAARRPYLGLAALRPLRLGRHARIVDVGCGGGELLLALRSIGFDHLLGVDPFVAADLDLGGGLRVLKADLASIEGERDLVMFHHSLEHIDAQQRVLSAAAALLAPKGRCLVRIPTVSSWAWRHYGVDWCGLDAPRHLYLHSVRSLRTLAGRCGLQVDGVVSDSTTFQFYGSEQYRRGIALMKPGSLDIAPAAGVFSAGELRAFAARARRLNRQGDGDQIVVTLSRAA